MKFQRKTMKIVLILIYIHVIEISDLVQEECLKNEVDVVHKLKGLSLLGAMKDHDQLGNSDKMHDHHIESPKDVVEHDDGYQHDHHLNKDELQEDGDLLEINDHDEIENKR